MRQTSPSSWLHRSALLALVFGAGGGLGHVLTKNALPQERQGADARASRVGANSESARPAEPRSDAAPPPDTAAPPRDIASSPPHPGAESEEPQGVSASAILLALERAYQAGLAAGEQESAALQDQSVGLAAAEEDVTAKDEQSSLARLEDLSKPEPEPEPAEDEEDKEDEPATRYAYVPVAVPTPIYLSHSSTSSVQTDEDANGRSQTTEEPPFGSGFSFYAGKEWPDSSVTPSSTSVYVGFRPPAKSPKSSPLAGGGNWRTNPWAHTDLSHHNDPFSAKVHKR